jgi:hypothetical protein
MTINNPSSITVQTTQQTGKSGAPNKKVYRKPRLGTVDLTAEQVLGLGCKTNVSTAASDISNCTAGVCFSTGTS